MSKSNCFLVSYIFDNQPHSEEVTVDAESLTPEQARGHIQPLHGAGELTDIQVTRIVHPHKSDTTPGHYQQP
ncbi:hypothetical protein ACX0MV_07660 [Pseudomonas borbori]